MCMVMCVGGGRMGRSIACEDAPQAPYEVGIAYHGYVKRDRGERAAGKPLTGRIPPCLVVPESEQAIVEGGGFNVLVGRHCVVFQCRRPCARLVPVLKRAAWTSYGEIGHEATEYEPWRGRDQRGAVQSATQTNRRRIPCWGQERQEGPGPVWVFRVPNQASYIVDFARVWSFYFSTRMSAGSNHFESGIQVC